MRMVSISPEARILSKEKTKRVGGWELESASSGGWEFGVADPPPPSPQPASAAPAAATGGRGRRRRLNGGAESGRVQRLRGGVCVDEAVAVVDVHTGGAEVVCRGGECSL